MKRTKINKFKTDLIITADWHLMEKERNPPCRLDSHWDAQWDKVNQILDLQNKYECPIYNAGDLFEHWKTSPYLLNKCLSTFPFGSIFTIIGNHDMPSHQIELMEKSGLYTLFKSEIIEHLRNQLDWEADPKKIEYLNIKNRKVIVAHKMIWQGEEPWPGCTDPEANKMFNLFPEADLIITGHNHKTFTAKKGNRLLINPGSLTRHKADQIDHKPCVFLWNAKSNTCKPHYLKIKDNVISREHIDIQKKKEQRAVAFIEKLKDDWDIGLSFEDNLEKSFQENDIQKSIKQIIYEWIGK